MIMPDIEKQCTDFAAELKIITSLTKRSPEWLQISGLEKELRREAHHAKDDLHTITSKIDSVIKHLGNTRGEMSPQIKDALEKIEQFKQELESSVKQNTISR